MNAKAKKNAADAPALPLDISARLQALEAKNAELEARAAAAEKEAADAKAAAAAAATAPAAKPGFQALTLTERDKGAGIVGRAVAILPAGQRLDFTAKKAANGVTYVREDFERRFVSDGKGGKRPTSGTDTDVATFVYLQNWRIENPDIVAKAATWAAEFAPAATA